MSTLVVAVSVSEWSYFTNKSFLFYLFSNSLKIHDLKKRLRELQSPQMSPRNEEIHQLRHSKRDLEKKVQNLTEENDRYRMKLDRIRGETDDSRHVHNREHSWQSGSGRSAESTKSPGSDHSESKRSSKRQSSLDSTDSELRDIITTPEENEISPFSSYFSRHRGSRSDDMDLSSFALPGGADSTENRRKRDKRDSHHSDFNANYIYDTSRFKSYDRHLARSSSPLGHLGHKDTSHLDVDHRETRGYNDRDRRYNHLDHSGRSPLQQDTTDVLMTGNSLSKHKLNEDVFTTKDIHRSTVLSNLDHTSKYTDRYSLHHDMADGPIGSSSIHTSRPKGEFRSSKDTHSILDIVGQNYSRSTYKPTALVDNLGLQTSAENGVVRREKKGRRERPHSFHGGMFSFRVLSVIVVNFRLSLTCNLISLRAPSRRFG